MPRYQYRCPACGRLTEADRRVEERNEMPICANPEHEEMRMEREITAHKSYSIKGDNSASVTPKKFRSQ